MRLPWLHAPQLPGNIGVVRAPLLHVGDGLRPEDPAGGLFVSGIVLNDGIAGQHGPFVGREVELCEPQSGLVEGMQEDVLGDLIGNIEGFLDKIGRQFELIQDLRILIELLEHNVVDLLTPQQQLVELQDVHPSDVQKLLVVVGVEGVEVDPLELDDGVGVHPLGGDFCVEAELLDLDGSELVEVLGGAGVEEHADLAERTHMLLVLQYLHPLHLLIGLSLLVDLAVLVLHLLRTVRHVDHDPFQVVHLDLADLHHRVAVVLLLLRVAQRAVVQHRVYDSSQFFSAFSGPSQRSSQQTLMKVDSLGLAVSQLLWYSSVRLDHLLSSINCSTAWFSSLTLASSFSLNLSFSMTILTLSSSSFFCRSSSSKRIFSCNLASSSSRRCFSSASFFRCSSFLSSSSCFLVSLGAGFGAI